MIFCQVRWGVECILWVCAHYVYIHIPTPPAALPTLDIAEGGLDNLIAIYKQLLPQWGGYLTLAGDLNHARLEQLLSRLGAMELDVLQQRAEDAEYFEHKKAAKRGGAESRNAGAPPSTVASESTTAALDNNNGSSTDEEEGPDAALDQQLQALALEDRKELEILAVAEGEAEPPTLAAAEPTMMSKEARALFLSGDGAAGLEAWRRRYYAEKLGGEVSPRDVVRAYIEGLHWVLEYYYRGVASWTWFYPYHYAPLASDCVDLPAITVQLELGEPFLPFEQLLGVLPAGSAQLLPEPYRVLGKEEEVTGFVCVCMCILHIYPTLPTQRLMTDPLSPIKDFYPMDFSVDLEGKRADWEGVVLIPFIDEQRLLSAARSVSTSSLSQVERQRNTLGNIFAFRYKEGSTDTSYCISTLPSHYSSVIRPNSICILMPPPPPLAPGTRGFGPQVVEEVDVDFVTGKERVAAVFSFLYTTTTCDLLSPPRCTRTPSWAPLRAFPRCAHSHTPHSCVLWVSTCLATQGKRLVWC